MTRAQDWRLFAFEVIGIVVMLATIAAQQWDWISVDRLIAGLSFGAIVTWWGQEQRTRRRMSEEAARTRRAIGELANWKARTVELTQANTQLRAALYKLSAEKAEYIRSRMN